MVYKKVNSGIGKIEATNYIKERGRYGRAHTHIYIKGYFPHVRKKNVKRNNKVQPRGREGKIHCIIQNVLEL